MNQPTSSPAGRKPGRAGRRDRSHRHHEAISRVKSLDAVNFGVRSGEIHALVGENGAGKSTLMKVLAGAYVPDEGALRFDGQPMVWKSPADAKAHGVHIIYQELVLFPQSSVAQNIFAGIEPHADWARSTIAR